MLIEYFMGAICSKIRVRPSILMLQKSPFSKINGRISPNLVGLYPPSKHLPFVFNCKNNVFLARIVAARNSNPRRKRNWLKAKDALKKTGLNTTEPSLMSENLSCEEDVKLTERRAIGIVVAAQANFMRVIVKKAGGDEEFEQEGGGGGRGKFGFNGNGASQKLDEHGMGLGRNIQLNSGVNGQTMNGIMENASKTWGDCDNERGNVDTDDNDSGHNRISSADSVMAVTGVSKTVNGNGCLDGGKDRTTLGAMPNGYRREEDASNNYCHRRNDDICLKELETRAGTELLCWVRALLKKMKRRVLVGDKVLVGGIDWVDKRGMIEDVFERKSELPEPPVANVDNLIVLFSIEQPKLEPFTLTRFLVEAESTEIPFKLVLNKTDLVQEKFLHEWQYRLQTWGYEPLFCSADTNAGLTNVANVLVGRTSVVVGPSGVGKSSLINALRRDLDICVTNEMNLFAGQVGEGSKWFQELRVGEISARSGRGKHTTRNVTLLPLSSGGYLTDTPGLSQPNLLKVTKNSLGWMFPEIRQMINSSESGRCRFRDCLHVGEPGCAVKGDWERCHYYLQLLDEIKIREEIQLRLIGTKRESDVRYKVGEMGVKHAEPRLEPKKHRRLSRKRINQSTVEELNKEFKDYKD